VETFKKYRKLLPTLELETSIEGIVAGVDEAGRGPLAGPVVASAVIIPRHFNISEINDSKKLSDSKRRKLFDRIISECEYGIGIVSVSDIDSINILQASMLAMRQAASKISATSFLIDGNIDPKIANARSYTIVKGDAKSISIAAASIVAKVTRDNIMNELHLEFPHYGWDKNSGYGTKEHRNAILKYGPCKHHRISFLRKVLGSDAVG